MNYLLTCVNLEREAEKDYEQGWKTYGFAAPFSRHGITAVSRTVGAQ